jgi:predicted small lipoprotein YifL
MKLIICTLTTMLLVLLFAGCGQSGPLYVPGDASSINVPPTAEANDKENDEDSKEDDSQ